MVSERWFDFDVHVSVGVSVAMIAASLVYLMIFPRTVSKVDKCNLRFAKILNHFLANN